jgi:hypothetical protein
MGLTTVQKFYSVLISESPTPRATTKGTEATMGTKPTVPKISTVQKMPIMQKIPSVPTKKIDDWPFNVDDESGRYNL